LYVLAVLLLLEVSTRAFLVVTLARYVDNSLPPEQHGEGRDLSYEAFDYVMGTHKKEGEGPGTVGYESNFHMVEAMAREHGGIVVAMDHVSLMEDAQTGGNLLSDKEQYSRIGVDDLIDTHEQFTAALRVHGAEQLFYDREHLTPIGTEIVAEAAFQYFVGHKTIEAVVLARAAALPTSTEEGVPSL
jgi:hypothetical protein